MRRDKSSRKVLQVLDHMLSFVRFDDPAWGVPVVFSLIQDDDGELNIRLLQFHATYPAWELMQVGGRWRAACGSIDVYYGRTLPELLDLLDVVLGPSLTGAGTAVLRPDETRPEGEDQCKRM